MRESQRRLQVVYSGRVQGVGFRFTAESLARGLSLVGWVRNLPDGRVQAVCEGVEADLRRFLDGVATSSLTRYIHGVEVNWSQATGEFSEFQIRP